VVVVTPEDRRKSFKVLLGGKKPPQKELDHGLYVTYRKYRCRCPECRYAAAVWKQKRA
jgi:hypothetical protein